MILRFFFFLFLVSAPFAKNNYYFRMPTASPLHRQLTFQSHIFAYTPSAFTTRFLFFFHLHYTFLPHSSKLLDFMIINTYNGRLAIHDHFLYRHSKNRARAEHLHPSCRNEIVDIPLTHRSR